ncbi:hypothetical protein OHT76_40175 [Streptomyces sp. NBC_00287]|uniref:hypothetical protein n=1 Tax=Streptomyces sp. NBC_00287 TaxID=2975702 RepID=UPI002E2AA0D9|nr:hypothetical protein [Streptomyces sp. NBC_00287]
MTADPALDEVEADLALTRGRVVHARLLEERVEDVRELELFERAARLYAQLGDARGEGEALRRSEFDVVAENELTCESGVLTVS